MDCRACSPASESRRLHELLYLSLSVFFLFFSFFFHGELKKRCARRMAHESSLSSLTALFFLFAILYWPIIAVRNANVGQQRTASNSAIRGQYTVQSLNAWAVIRFRCHFYFSVFPYFLVISSLYFSMASFSTQRPTRDLLLPSDPLWPTALATYYSSVYRLT